MSNASFLFFIFLSAYIKFQVVLMLSIIDHQLTSLCSSRIHPIDCFFLFHWLYFSFPRFLISVFILPDTILFLYIIIFSISCFCDGSFFFFSISEHPQDTYFKIFGGSTERIASEMSFCCYYWFYGFSFLALNFFICFRTLFCNLLLSERFCVLMSSYLSPTLPFLYPPIRDSAIYIRDISRYSSGARRWLGSVPGIEAEFLFTHLPRPTLLLKATVVVGRRWSPLLSAFYYYE